jgi:hypothetical protein
VAPSPKTTPEAVVQVYSARLWGWRGAFGVHTWLATKHQGASHYQVYRVIGWYYYMGKKPLFVGEDIPDRKWFDNVPEVLVDLRGKSVEKIIDKIERAARAYPLPDYYVMWPGPNSNSFTAYIARNVPELHLTLPPHAIGKDFLVDDGLLKTNFFAKTPSGTGIQFSFFGMAGVSVGLKEGLECNFMGLNFGIDFSDFALLLPGWGKIPLKTT